MKIILALVRTSIFIFYILLVTQLSLPVDLMPNYYDLQELKDATLAENALQCLNMCYKIYNCVKSVFVNGELIENGERFFGSCFNLNAFNVQNGRIANKNSATINNIKRKNKFIKIQAFLKCKFLIYFFKDIGNAYEIDAISTSKAFQVHIVALTPFGTSIESNKLNIEIGKSFKLIPYSIFFFFYLQMTWHQSLKSGRYLLMSFQLISIGHSQKAFNCTSTLCSTRATILNSCLLVFQINTKAQHCQSQLILTTCWSA
jgi:hypothetical protein